MPRRVSWLFLPDFVPARCQPRGAYPNYIEEKTKAPPLGGRLSARLATGKAHRVCRSGTSVRQSCALRQVVNLPTYPPLPNRALNAALAKIPRSMGPAPVERSRLSSYPPGKERFSRPRPEMSHRLARSEAATLPGLLRRLEFAGRALPRNSRPCSKA